LIATLGSMSLAYTDASGKGNFGYRVRATNTNGAGEWSAWADVTVTSVSTKGGGDTKSSPSKGKKK